jgi:hypothetical protein
MTPKEPVFHTQDLVDGIFKIEYFPDRRAKHGFNLMQAGRPYPLNHANLQTLRKYKYIFGEDAKGCPILSVHEDFPFAILPTTREIARILSSDIGGKNYFRFAPSRGSPSLDAQATMSLLPGNNNPFYNARSTVIHMSSPLHSIASDEPQLPG